MTTTAPTATTDGSWTAGFATLAATCPEEVEVPVSGTLPAGLAGTWYRIGPARHDVAGERYGHWFDGDPAVHALRIGGGRAWYRSAWVASAPAAEERAAGRRLWGGAFWTPPTGGPLARVRRARKNVPNINIVPQGDRLLALSEGGWPVAIDPVTLATRGEDDLGGALSPGDGFSAHPKVDPTSGELWNFGVRYGASTTLTVYRSTTARTAWERHASVPLDRGHMIHDLALTERCVVIVCVPFVLPRLPLALLAGRKGYGQALRWEPELGTTVVVVDRATGEVRRFATEPFFTFHLARAADDRDGLHLDLCTYPDAGVVAAFAGVMAGRADVPAPRLQRLSLCADGRSSRRDLTSLPVELPRARPDGRILGLATTDGAPLGNTICAVEPSGRAVCAPGAPGHFAGEPVQTRDGSVLTVVLDAPAGRSEVRVHPPDLGAPVATIPLPHAVPLALHGNWVPTRRDGET